MVTCPTFLDGRVELGTGLICNDPRTSMGSKNYGKQEAMPKCNALFCASVWTTWVQYIGCFILIANQCLLF